MRRAIHSN